MLYEVITHASPPAFVGFFLEPSAQSSWNLSQASIAIEEVASPMPTTDTSIPSLVASSLNAAISCANEESACRVSLRSSTTLAPRPVPLSAETSSSRRSLTFATVASSGVLIVISSMAASLARGEERFLVITSYSIHYTKLYEESLFSAGEGGRHA